jgi:hypothetical protein
VLEVVAPTKSRYMVGDGEEEHFLVLGIRRGEECEHGLEGHGRATHEQLEKREVTIAGGGAEKVKGMGESLAKNMASVQNPWEL